MQCQRSRHAEGIEEQVFEGDLIRASQARALTCLYWRSLPRSCSAQTDVVSLDSTMDLEPECAYFHHPLNVEHKLVLAKVRHNLLPGPFEADRWVDLMAYCIVEGNTWGNQSEERSRGRGVLPSIFPLRV